MSKNVANYKVSLRSWTCLRSAKIHLAKRNNSQIQKYRKFSVSLNLSRGNGNPRSSIKGRKRNGQGREKNVREKLKVGLDFAEWECKIGSESSRYIKKKGHNRNIGRIDKEALWVKSMYGTCSRNRRGLKFEGHLRLATGNEALMVGFACSRKFIFLFCRYYFAWFRFQTQCPSIFIHAHSAITRAIGLKLICISWPRTWTWPRFLEVRERYFPTASINRVSIFQFDIFQIFFKNRILSVVFYRDLRFYHFDVCNLTVISYYFITKRMKNKNFKMEIGTAFWWQ